MAKARKEPGETLSDYQQRFIAEYYVYHLIDPRDGKVFYVGKGTKKRVKEHVRAVRAGRVNNAKKHLYIKSIHDDGLEVIEEIVRDGMTEKEAYDLERQEIVRLWPSGLTNCSRGQRDRHSREIAEYGIRLEHFVNSGMCDALPKVFARKILKLLLLGILGLMPSKIKSCDLAEYAKLRRKVEWAVNERVRELTS